MFKRILAVPFTLSLALLLTSAPLAQAQASGGAKAPTSAVITQQTRLNLETNARQLAGSLSSQQKSQIKAILNANKPPALPKLDKSATAQQRMQQGAQLMSMSSSVNDNISRVNTAIKAVLNAKQASLFEANLLPNPGGSKHLTPQTGSGYCYDAYYYNYYYVNYYAYYSQQYGYYQVLYDGGGAAIDSYILALGSYVSSYNAYLYSLYAYEYDQSSYSFYAYYDSEYATYQADAAANLDYNLGYLMDGSDNAYYVYYYGYYANYYGYNYASYYAYYCYAGY